MRQAVTLAGAAASKLGKPQCLPLEACSTDFTEIIYAHGQRKASLMVLLCITTRWAVANRRSTELALSCLDELNTNLAQLGHTRQGRIVHHDKDSIYTDYAWLKRVLLKEAAIVSFAQHEAKDNPWIESFWGRFKIEKCTLCLRNDEPTTVHDRRPSALLQRGTAPLSAGPQPTRRNAFGSINRRQIHP